MPTVCACGLQALGYSRCYACLKRRVDWSHDPPSPDGLSPSEQMFVGLFETRPNRDGWHSPDLEPYEAVDDYLTDQERSLLAFLSAPAEPEEMEPNAGGS